MSTDFHVEERTVHGLTWQIILTDWGIHRAEANLAFAAICAQLETLTYRDAVWMHAELLKTAAQHDEHMQTGELPVLMSCPVRAIEMQRTARRAALNDWPSAPVDTHLIHIGAMP